MMLGLSTAITGNGGIAPLLDYALEFNGTDEYLSIALPNNELLASAGVTDFYSSGSAIAGWTELGTIAWNGTETGKTYANTISLDTFTELQKTCLTVGQKYKIKIRYQAPENGLNLIGFNVLLPDTFGEWNTVSKVATAIDPLFGFACTDYAAVIDYASVKRDQGFDLNKDQEQILHSRNALFNNAGTDWVDGSSHTFVLSTVDKSEGTGSILITADAAGSETADENVSLPSANIESVVSGKKYTIQGEARLDASSLGYDANLLTPDGTSGWTAGNGTGSVVTGEYVLASTGTGYIYRTLTSANKVLKVTFKAKADTYTGSIRVYHNSTVGAVSTGNLTGIYQTFTLYLNSHTAAATFYVQLNSSHTGNIYFDDITIQDATPITLTARIGSKSVTSSALSIVAGTFTKFVLNFEATASEQSQDLKLYLSGAGSVFVDKLSLTQAYDAIVRYKKKSASYANEDYIYATGAGSSNEIGHDIYISAVGAPTIAVRQSTTSNIGLIASNPVTTSDWFDVLAVINRDSSTSSYIRFRDTNTIGNLSTIGKIIVTKKMAIGAWDTSGADCFNGQLSYFQIIRFENISQSTFNSALTGLQYPTGGGSEEVLRLTFQSGVNITECLKDYSPKAHTVTGINIDISNRKKVTT